MPRTEEGLKKVKKLSEDKDWLYAGGTYNEFNPCHSNYWNIFKKDYYFGDKDFNKGIWRPFYKSQCVCGEKLEHNCWLYNPKRNKFRVIGSTCIKNFTDKKRQCFICKEDHQNRTTNRCNNCKENHIKKNRWTDNKYGFKRFTWY
tara:strand:+ start:181 stop:615 length:435 start_codon:yes stop_codon:yes gene_type:complete